MLTTGQVDHFRTFGFVVRHAEVLDLPGALEGW